MGCYRGRSACFHKPSQAIYPPPDTIPAAIQDRSCQQFPCQYIYLHVRQKIVCIPWSSRDQGCFSHLYTSGLCDREKWWWFSMPMPRILLQWPGGGTFRCCYKGPAMVWIKKRCWWANIGGPGTAGTTGGKTIPVNVTGDKRRKQKKIGKDQQEFFPAHPCQ